MGPELINQMRRSVVTDWGGASGYVLKNEAGVALVYNVGSLFTDQQGHMPYRAMSLVDEIAMHHDAVAFSGKDTNTSGSTFDESLSRLRAIYNWHTNLNGVRGAGEESWGGIGYHAVIDSEGRIFIPRLDVLNTRRAHVAGYDAARKAYLNQVAVGICLMGNFADSFSDVTGSKVAVVADRPTPKQLASFNVFAQAVTNYAGKPLELHPHSWYARYPGQSAKPCPGNWVAKDAWSGSSDFRYKPEVAAPPEPKPAPKPINPEDLTLKGLADMMQALVDELKTRV